jgi:hypothetical protein
MLCYSGITDTGIDMEQNKRPILRLDRQEVCCGLRIAQAGGLKYSIPRIQEINLLERRSY